LERVKSIGQQITLPRDYHSHEEIKVVILELADLVARRVRAGGYVGKTVVLSLKDASFAWLSRRCTLSEYTELAFDIYQAAVKLLTCHWPEGWPVRLVGVTLAGLIPKRVEQLNLFKEKEKLKSSERACDRIKSRVGEKTIFRAVSLTRAGVRYG
jgi:DNA polymerase-4